MVPHGCLLADLIASQGLGEELAGVRAEAVHHHGTANPAESVLLRLVAAAEVAERGLGVLRGADLGEFARRGDPLDEADLDQHLGRLAHQSFGEAGEAIRAAQALAGQEEARAFLADAAAALDQVVLARVVLADDPGQLLDRLGQPGTT